MAGAVMVLHAYWRSDGMTDCGLTDSRIDGLTGLTDSRSDGLTEWRTDRLTERRTDRLTDWRIGGLTDWQSDGVTNWRIDGLTDWRSDAVIHLPPTGDVIKERPFHTHQITLEPTNTRNGSNVGRKKAFLQITFSDNLKNSYRVIAKG